MQPVLSILREVRGGNEVAATLALLKTLVLKGCIVTADALHCHPRMAEGVLASGADYALGLKGNHGPLHAAAVSAFEQATPRASFRSLRPPRRRTIARNGAVPACCRRRLMRRCFRVWR